MKLYNDELCYVTTNCNAFVIRNNITSCDIKIFVRLNYKYCNDRLRDKINHVRLIICFC